jgi:uncharacterized membrane protein YkoI
MSKKTWIIAVAVVAALGVTGTVAAQSVGGMIGKDKAREIALQTVDGTVDDVELEYKNGLIYYEVDIDRLKHADDEVEVRVDAKTGKVLAVVEDDDRDLDLDRVGQTSEVSNDTVNKTFITAEQARQIAVKTVDGTVIEVDRDIENGVPVYEVELRTSTGEDEVEIDAASGKVLSVEHDRFDDDDDNWID